MEGGGGVDAAGGGVHKWRLAHVCAFAFLLHLKPSEHTRYMGFQGGNCND